MVEGECIHRGNLIPKTAISSQKAALRESNFKRYGRRQIYTHRKLWFPKRPFWARKKLYGNQISRGMVEGECIHIGIWFPKRPFWARKQLYGNEISRGMVEGECIHIGNLIPKTAISSQKAALRESNFKRYGRRRMYTHRKFDSQNGPFEPERSFTGIKFQEVYTHRKFDSQNGPFRARKQLYGNQISRGMVEGECIHRGIWFPKRPFRARKQLYGNQISRGIVEGKYIHIGNLIPKTAISSQKAALRESNFKRYGRRRMYTQRKFDSRKASFWLKRAVLGVKFPMCIYLPSTIPIEIWFP